MLKIRLIKKGSKQKPYYQIGVLQAKTKRNGFVIQLLGFYNPKTKSLKIIIPLLLKHLKCGAQPTTQVRVFLRNSNIISNF